MAKREPWHPARFGPPEIAAVKALATGTASAGQQKLALEWILLDVCGIRNELFVPAADDVRNYLLGRRSVGLQIARLMEMRAPVDPRGAPPPVPGTEPTE